MDAILQDIVKFFFFLNPISDSLGRVCVYVCTVEEPLGVIVPRNVRIIEGRCHAWYQLVVRVQN